MTDVIRLQQVLKNVWVECFKFCIFLQGLFQEINEFTSYLIWKRVEVPSVLDASC